MNRRRWSLLAACLVVASSASAVSPQRTFVASYGKDTDPCSLTLPCRGFQAAIDAVAVGGEVVALDSAGYGAMEIHKSVSVIVPPGIHAGLSPATGIPLPGYPGQFGVVLIDILDTDVVVLRGLNINHQGTVTGGIEWISAHGGTVYVEDTVINGFPKEGVYVQAPTGRLFVKDTILRNNNVGLYGAIAGGVAAHSSGGILIDHVRVENSGDAIRLLSGVYARLSNSVVTSNSVAFNLQATSEYTVLTVDHCTVSENGYMNKLDSAGAYGTQLVIGASALTMPAPSARTGPNNTVISLSNNTSLDAFIFDVTYPAK